MSDKPPASILVVEDHLEMGRFIGRLLREEGQLEVAAIARSGEEALAKLAELEVDLVLVDVSLPAMSGIDLVGALPDAFRAPGGELRSTFHACRRKGLYPQRERGGHPGRRAARVGWGSIPERRAAI